MTEALKSEWVILTDDNMAIRFDRHELRADFSVFSASLTTRWHNGKKESERWELDDCGESWALDQSADAFWLIRGRIKWDGCVDWETNPDCMMHGCGPSHGEWVAKMFEVIYAYAKRHFDLLGDETKPMPEPALELAA